MSQKASFYDFDAIAERITPDQLAEVLGAQRVGSSWRCPFKERHKNDDRDPSFSLFRDAGRTAAACHGCGLKGSPVRLYAEVHGCTEQEAAQRLAAIVGLHPTEAGTNGRTVIVEAYSYVDEEGRPLYRMVRTSPKGFFYQRPDGQDGWIKGLGDTRRVLYHLPELIEAVAQKKPVYVVEGEKDVHAIERAGGVATTNPGGAGRWREEFNDFLRGAEVIIVADKDEPGRVHARCIADELCAVAKSVRIVEAATGKDAHDHLNAGRGLEEFVPVEPGASGVSKPLRESLLWTLGDLKTGRSLTASPEPVAWNLGWPGRVTLLVAHEKTGKSTLASAMAVAVCQGKPFLGRPTHQGPVVYFALEEHPEDVATRLRRFGATDGDQLFMVSRSHSPFRDLREAVEDVQTRMGRPPTLIVVDSLAYLTSDLIKEASSSADWMPVMKHLTELARDYGTAVVLLHHARRKDNQYRDSSVIGAEVDVIVMMRDGREDAVREFEIRGRWTIEPFSIRLVDEPDGMLRYETRATDLRLRILGYVRNNPGSPKRNVIHGAGGRTEDTGDVINQMLAAGELENRGSPSAMALIVGAQGGMETAEDE